MKVYATFSKEVHIEPKQVFLIDRIREIIKYI